MNILITGANGQLGSEIRVLSAQYAQHRFFMTDVAELDITDRASIRNYCVTNNIDSIINCAAYTNVDKAEEDEQTAHLLNALAAENLAVVAQETDARLVHISTDYVFNGAACVPYREQDKPEPRTAYGRTKLEGERLVTKACPTAIIVRTAWLYSSFGNNFVKTMLRLSETNNSLRVVYDQIGTPTYARDLAKAVLQILIDKGGETLNGDGNNIYHFTNEGVCSWFDFTKEIFHLAGVDCEVEPIRSEQYHYRTPRPHYSVLDKQKIKDCFSITIPYWTDSLRDCLTILRG